MARVDVQDSVVQVSATSGGTYATIVDLRSWDGTHGEESEARIRVFGNPDPIIRAGDDTDEYKLSGLYDVADTGGQNVIRTAKDARTTVYLRVLPGGTAIGAKGYTQECRVSEYTDSGAADGDFVECSFALRGVGARVAYTVPS
ncbi:MAG: hypothetical protein JWM27_4733 [Gemmatimonadetes bacterium]|nr:hypothetical protein [Gemmatimonadota bacterium]